MFLKDNINTREREEGLNCVISFSLLPKQMY